ncbi:MAG: HD-GYP domain-containing protein [Ruminococcaceae bacterium]|nr:HD-GYP domain-containing protein [Oscillospiraceae bacterium]
MNKKSNKKAIISFCATLLAVIALFSTVLIKTNLYNQKVHSKTVESTALFSEPEKKSGITVSAVPRSSTWGKIFDFNNEGITENNYQAFTYDITVANNTKDEVKDLTFKLIFEQEVYLSSAWNGSLEIHQKNKGGEQVADIPDLREFKADDYELETYVVDGESLIKMKKGDYLIYTPSTSTNALEIPIEPRECTVPGFILYVPMEVDFNKASIVIDYSFHRLISSEPLFWISCGCLLIWLIALIIFIITSIQVKKYNERHMRDNEIINESIETFTGFIDAKDPYTNGHSKRVAIYTKRIAEAMGYEGEELERIYYIALLHDCGKIGVPDGILGKPGRLTDEEYEIIKSHTVRGGEILSSFKSLPNVGEGALYHHERYDGKGYPEGKAGEDIPLIARMICVADSYDAMNTNRVYRKHLSKEEIIREIESNKGKQFDPEIADIFLGLIKNGKVN